MVALYADLVQGARERVVVALTESPTGEALIRRASVMVGDGDLIGLHVRPSDPAAGDAAEWLEHHRRVLSECGGSLHVVVSSDVPAALVAFAQAEGATQLVLGSTRRSRWTELMRGSVINTVIRQAGSIDVHVIDTGSIGEPTRHRVHLRGRVFTRRRTTAGWALAIGGTALLTALFAHTRDLIGDEAHSLLYLTLVLAAAVVGGVGPALGASIMATAALNWFFTPPLYTWTIGDLESLIALAVFAVTGVGVSLLATQVARRSHDAARARAEAEALARAAGGLVADDDPLPAILDGLRTSLELEGVSLLAAQDGGWVVAAQSGAAAPRAREHATMTLDLPDGSVVALAGAFGVEEGRVLRAFAAQLAGAIDRQRLREEAAEAQALAEADALRTALLRAVSHDLRTPLASIKASVTSLLQGDVVWSDAEEKEFLATIDEESDRLNRLVGNLLDMSRLEAGAVRPDARAVAVEDVIPAALASISGLHRPVTVDVPDDLPLVRADPALFERALANVIANAFAAAPHGTPVEVRARPQGSAGAPGPVALEVTDRGEGIPAAARNRIFEPFQRLDDRGGGGVGLGLAVARGLLEVMGATIEATESPGGGTTMLISLPPVSAGARGRDGD